MRKVQRIASLAFVEGATLRLEDDSTPSIMVALRH